MVIVCREASFFVVALGFSAWINMIRAQVCSDYMPNFTLAYEDVERLKAMPRAFAPAVSPPPTPASPRNVIVLMRHGDRTLIQTKVGDLDLSHLESAWERMMPSAEQEAALNRFPVQVLGNSTSTVYEASVGKRPFGQLTSQGVRQCQAVGAELKSRYPNAKIRAYSTNFPRTQKSAAAVLSGFDPSEAVSIVVREPSKETLLPNFDGSCNRFHRMRAEQIAKARQCLPQATQALDAELRPVLGEKTLSLEPDFRPLCEHEDTLGSFKGVTWGLMLRNEGYRAAVEAVIYNDTEVIRLASGRFLEGLREELSKPWHELVLMLAHDTMLTAVLAGLGLYRSEWPLYASAIVIESADMENTMKVRVTFNNEVRIDWTRWADFWEKLNPMTLTDEQYRIACNVVV